VYFRRHRVDHPPFAGEQEGTSSTSYWYGGELNPLVVTRDGVSYRLIGKSVVEMLGSEVTRTYAHADHLGSLRMVTDDGGEVVQSLSYDDYGLTRIAGESTAATDGSMASLYRFQGQEQEVFPGIDDPSLAAWLDQIQLYHFPWRDYATGLAAFTETDPFPTPESLYSALTANPVNVTDETGGIAILYQYDRRLNELAYQLRLNGGRNLSLEDRQYFSDVLEKVTAETPEQLKAEVLGELSVWQKRYEQAMETSVVSVESEIKQDMLALAPDRVFSPEDEVDIRNRAEDLVMRNRSPINVEWALEELTFYRRLETPDLQDKYEGFRQWWISIYEPMITKLRAQKLPLDDGTMKKSLGHHSSADPWDELGAPWERYENDNDQGHSLQPIVQESGPLEVDGNDAPVHSQVEEQEEKAEVKEQHDEKSHVPHSDTLD
jgi:hypothetical protein